MLNLEKNEVMSIDNGIREIRIGIGWDEVGKISNQGIFGFAKSLVNKYSDDIDVDASVIIRRPYEQCQEIVYYGHKDDYVGFIHHKGDNLTGADVPGEKDDETIIARLDKAPKNVNKLQFIVNIYRAYSRDQHFGMINNAYARIYNNETGECLAKFDLSGDYNKLTGVLMGSIERTETGWSFKTSGQGWQVANINELEDKCRC